MLESRNLDRITVIHWVAPPDRDELIRVLIASTDGELDRAPGEITHAWDKEMERRIADLDSGKTVRIPAEQVLAEMRAIIAGHGESSRRNSSPRRDRNLSKPPASISGKREPSAAVGSQARSRAPSPSSLGCPNSASAATGMRVRSRCAAIPNPCTNALNPI